MERHDTDGDGKISDTERKAAKEKRRAKMVERFDSDGDGELNDSERQSAKVARDKFRERKEHQRDRKAGVAGDS